MSAIIEKLCEVQGIGKVKATELYNSGARSIKDLNNKKYHDMLNEDTKIFLKYKPLRKISRRVMDDIVKMIAPCLSKFKYDIAGSYRRQKSFSRDMDILVIAKDIDEVIKAFAPLNIIIYAKGNDKFSALIAYKKIYIRLDVMRCLEDAYPAFLLYLTGSKEHNILMRHIAKKKNLLLNQNGIFKDGKIIKINSEEDIFKILGMKYRPPEKR